VNLPGNRNTKLATKVAHENYTGDRLFEQRALALATAAHQEVGQKNIYTGQDYITPPIAVVQLLRIIGASSVVIAAGYLHDAWEDTNITIPTLMEQMGAQVTNLVIEVSNVSTPQHGNRQTRKELDRQHFARASEDGQNIKLADMIANISTLGSYDPKFMRVYLLEKIDLFKVLTKGHPRLRMMALELLNEKSIQFFGHGIEYDISELHNPPGDAALLNNSEVTAPVVPRSVVVNTGNSVERELLMA
jgi:(p)ppGpp synthase/HD superfamily hydrolase